MKYNIWNKWDPLKVCMLGNNYAPEFFNGIPDKVGDPLKRICEETLEDLEGYKRILQDFGVKVIQPEMDRSERFIDNPIPIVKDSQSRYRRGPLQPRDYQLVLGNTCLVNDGFDHPSIIDSLNDYAPVFYNDKQVWKTPFFNSEDEYNKIKGVDYPSYQDYFQNRTNSDYFLPFVWEELQTYSNLQPGLNSAFCFMVGNRLYMGNDNGKIFIDIPRLKNELPEFNKFQISVTPVEGHGDGNFHPIKPGAILSLYDVQNYAETFPGWDICYLPDQSYAKVASFLELKKKNAGKWWLAGEEDNDEFTNFVETWLQDWVGYVEETVFDVNVLVLDEHHVCVSQPNNENVNKFLKKHNMEPVYVSWRHRFFWDGGLHCITLDLHREGVQQDYF